MPYAAASVVRARTVAVDLDKLEAAFNEAGIDASGLFVAR